MIKVTKIIFHIEGRSRKLYLIQYRFGHQDEFLLNIWTNKAVYALRVVLRLVNTKKCRTFMVTFFNDELIFLNVLSQWLRESFHKRKRRCRMCITYGLPPCPLDCNNFI